MALRPQTSQQISEFVISKPTGPTSASTVSARAAARTCAHTLRPAAECGLMSTTASRETAVANSAGVDGERGTVLEIAAGRVDAGASVGFLSQYPAEEEFLLQPLSSLEVGCPVAVSRRAFLFPMHACLHIFVRVCASMQRAWTRITCIAGRHV